jgi:hypothetical protein
VKTIVTPRERLGFPGTWKPAFRVFDAGLLIGYLVIEFRLILAFLALFFDFPMFQPRRRGGSVQRVQVQAS